MLQAMPRPAGYILPAALAATAATLSPAGGLLRAQRPAPSVAPRAPKDSLSRTDTTKRVTLPPVEVRVTRTAEDRARLPMAVGVLGEDALRRAQLTSGLDESLSRLPGVVVLNRYNYSLDQRVSLRGAGEPRQLRPPRRQGAHRRRAADAPRRPESAHQPGARHREPGRGPDRPGRGALR